MTQVGAQYLKLQLVWCALGFFLCVSAASIDYQLLKKITWPLFGVACVMLLLVLLPLPHGITKKINGAHRWFILPGMRLQPSELGKLALIIVLAWYGERFQRKNESLTFSLDWHRGADGPVIGVMLGLVFVEPDRGTTILLAMVSGSMLLLCGVQWKFIVPPVICAGYRTWWFQSLKHDPMRMELHLPRGFIWKRTTSG